MLSAKNGERKINRRTKKLRLETEIGIRRDERYCRIGEKQRRKLRK